MLRDEARHGPFGERVGAFALAGCDDAVRQAWWPHCAAELQTMEARVGGPFDEAALAREAEVADLDALESLGLVRGSATCASFERAVVRQVVPALRRLGVVPP